MLAWPAWPAPRPCAQRGGVRRVQPQSYTGNVRYDGKFVFVRMSYPVERRPRRAAGRTTTRAARSTS